MAAPKYPERSEISVGTLDKGGKEGKETEHTRGAELVTGGARITTMANKANHICEERSWLMATSESPALFVGHMRQGSKLVTGDARVTMMANKTEDICD